MLQKPLLRPLSPHSGVAPFHMICTYDNEDAAIKIASLMASHNASTSILRKMRLFDHAMDSWDLNMNTLAARLNKNRLAMMLTTLHNQTTYKVSGSTQGPHDIQNHPHRISTLAKYIIYEDTSIENKDQAMRNFLNMIYRQNEAYEKSLQYMLFTLELAGSHAQDTTSTRTIINRMHDRVQEHSEATQNNQNGPVELLLQFVATRTDCILADTFAYVISEYKHMLPADFDTFIQNYAVTNMHNAYPQGMSSYAINRNIYNLLMHNNTNNIITDLAQRMRRKEAFPVEVKYAVQHATKTAAEYRDQETGDTFLHCMAYMPKSYVLFPYIAQDVLQQQGGFTYHQNRGLEVQPLYNADNETPENIARREHPDTHFVDKLQDHKGTYYMIHSGSPHITSDSNNNYRHAQLSSDYSYEIAKFL